ncbi:MAG: type II toxin-antitoxin system prevent-host-death family antitoxin [Spirochaetia bacterium]
MKKASITEAKNHLSRLLEIVKSGTTILILDRNKPVARLEPVANDEETNSERIVHLIRQGLASAPKRSLDVQDFLNWKRPKLPNGGSAVQFLIEEREQGR